MEIPRACLDSRMSSASNGTNVFMHDQQPSCFETLRDLYKVMEPQLCKSYRKNVKYVPATCSESDQQTLHPSRARSKVKTARIVIEAVHELQRKQETSINKEKSSVGLSKSPVPKSPAQKSPAPPKSPVPSKGKLSPRFNESKETSQSLSSLTIN